MKMNDFKFVFKHVYKNLQKFINFPSTMNRYISYIVTQLTVNN